MSKLLQFKEWLTIPEAIDYLSKELGESIKESDLYQLALNKQIDISVLLLDSECCDYSIYVKANDDEIYHFKNLENKRQEQELSFDEQDFLSRMTRKKNTFYKHFYEYYIPTNFFNIYNDNDINTFLSYIYNISIAQSNHHLIEKPTVIFLETEDKIFIKKIIINNGYCPTDLLQFIIKKENLDKFINMLNQEIGEQSAPPTTNKPLNTTEKENILKVLAIFIAYNKELGDVSTTPKYPLANILIEIGNKYNIDLPSENTIVKFIDGAKTFIPTK